MLSEAVLPPSKEHSYAQWLERTYERRESRALQTGKAVSLLSPVTTEQSGVSQGMETVVYIRECLDIQLLFMWKDQDAPQLSSMVMAL